MKFKTFRAIVITGALGSCGTCSVLGAHWLAEQPTAQSASPTPIAAQPALPRPTVSPQPALPPSTVSPQPEPATSMDVPKRPFDDRILAFAGHEMSRRRLDDAFPDEKEKVTFFADPETHRIVRAKVAMDRHSPWEEEWLFEAVHGRSKVVRKVARPGEHAFTVRYELRNGAWVLSPQ